MPRIRIKGDPSSKTWFINNYKIDEPLTVGDWTIRCIRNHRIIFSNTGNKNRQIMAMMSLHKPHLSVRYLDNDNNEIGERFEYLTKKIDGYIVLTNTDIEYCRNLSEISKR